MDNAIVNLPLSKLGNIDSQIDAHKAKLAKEETKQALKSGVVVLWKGGVPRVFSNRATADKSAARTGGEAYQDMRSMRFMVRFA